MKKGYCCAPNGKPSKLTEEQWLTVRTPNFKRWFGDWEALAEKDVLLALKEINLERIDLTQFAIDEKRPVNARGVVAYLKEKYKDDVKNGVLSFTENPLGAPIEVGRYATSGFAGKNAGNAEAFLSLLNIKSILKDSVVINSETNWKNRDYDSAILANKIKIGDEEYISTVVVEQIPQSNNKYKNRGYVVDAISIARLNKGTVLQFNARVGDKAPFDTNNTVLMRKVLQNIWNVNKKDVSRVVDENGEPMVVYHGTPTGGFTVFDNDLVESEYGFFFNDSKAVADEYAATPDGYEPMGENKVYAVFLNIRNPYEKDFKGASYGDLWTEMDVVKEDGHDGFIGRNIIDNRFTDSENTIPSTDFVVLNSNQIKDAVGNVGTFSENPDIRWSFRDEAELEALDKRHRELYEAYKNGDRGAFAKAAKLVAGFARGTSYKTKVYHGTGADGFNVAKADASEAQNGEGAQVHGMGLYMAKNKATAEVYLENAPKQDFHTIGGRTLEELGITRENFDGVYVEGLVQTLHSLGVVDAKREKKERIKGLKRALKDEEKVLAESHFYSDKEWAQARIDDTKKQIADEKKALSAIDKILSILEENGLSISDYEYRISDGKLFDWFTNLNEENTLDEDKRITRHGKAIQEKYKKAYEEDILPLLKELYGSDEYEFKMGTSELTPRNIVGNIVESAKTLIGENRFRKIMLKHGIKGMTYNGRWDGRCYVSFEGGSAVKLQDPFTFDDNGKYIPLDRRGDSTNPDMRFSIAENSKYDNYRNELHKVARLERYEMQKENIMVGATPNALKLIGFEDRPLFLSGGVVWKSMFNPEKARYIPEKTLGKIGEAIEDPLFIEQSATMPQNAIVVHTELEHNGEKLGVAIHLSKEKDGYIIHNIASVYPRSQPQKDRVLTDGRLLYLNTQKGLSEFSRSQELQLPRPENLKDLFVGKEVRTQKELSQYNYRNRDNKFSAAEKSAKFTEIKRKIDAIQKDFNRRAKIKSDVSVVGTLEDARGVLGAESIPYNARAVQDKERVVIIAENIADADEAVRIFLHELVGHWGVKKLFKTKADLKPFLNYIIAHYQDSDAWKRVSKYYKDVTKNKYAIAEEVLAHVAENRELSDPSMWKRLVHRVKRELWGNGVPQEYVNLLNEDVLRSAIALTSLQQR